MNSGCEASTSLAGSPSPRAGEATTDAATNMASAAIAATPTTRAREESAGVRVQSPNGGSESMKRAFPLRMVAATATAAVCLLTLAASAEAHGPVAPIASSYLARVVSLPPGLDAKVIDGDQRMWLDVAPTKTVIVLDYRGAPYLRFTPAGIDVNQNSAMYYLNQTPAEVPPSGLTPQTLPKWSNVSGGHSLSWHDGRLHALASVAIAPGRSYVGRWTIPLRINGRPNAIAGGLWHADSPSIVWFWPIVVLILCTLAARRVHRPELDALTARLLAVPTLLATAVAALGRELHGRPTVTATQLITLAIVLAFVAWALRQVLFRRPNYFTYFPIAFVALWEGLNVVSTLLNGFVLAAVPALLARVAAVLCIGGGVSLLIVPARLDRPGEDDEASTRQGTDGYSDDDAPVRGSYA
jgi:hypothetical protein